MRQLSCRMGLRIARIPMVASTTETTDTMDRMTTIETTEGTEETIMVAREEVTRVRITIITTRAKGITITTRGRITTIGTRATKETEATKEIKAIKETKVTREIRVIATKVKTTTKDMETRVKTTTNMVSKGTIICLDTDKMETITTTVTKDIMVSTKATIRVKTTRAKITRITTILDPTPDRATCPHVVSSLLRF